MADNQMEKMIIESVLNELAKRGITGQQTPSEKLNQEEIKPELSRLEVNVTAEDESEEILTLPEINEVWVPEGENLKALQAMKNLTPARIGLYRSGTRQKTKSLLRFLGDHASALDAVFMDVSEEMLKKENLFSVQSLARDKEEFLRNPETGNKLSDNAIKVIEENCEKNCQVQVIICDGLSSTAIERNIPDILPSVMEGLQAAGIKVGKPFFIKNSRVRIMDHVGEILHPQVILEFIGERPGLRTVESMSAYACYKPDKNTVEADRTMISNIHHGGTPPAEAGAQLVELIQKMLKYEASGISLNKKVK